MSPQTVTVTSLHAKNFASNGHDHTAESRELGQAPDPESDPLAAELQQMASSTGGSSTASVKDDQHQRLDLTESELDKEEPWHPLKLGAEAKPGAALDVKDETKHTVDEGKRSE
jgi:hypothetical protein